MEWRQQTSASCADAFSEAQRWIQEVTGKLFGYGDFRAALENGVLLCDLINQLKPGIIRKVNRLSTPIAGLDNVNLFLKACGKLGLNESQLFHPGDLQDLSTRATLRQDESSRRLKNVLITIYWLGRKAHVDTCYLGPQLNFKAFEGLLGLALSKSLDEGSNIVKEDEYGECFNSEKDHHARLSYRKQNCVEDDPADSLVHPNREGCGSDAEAEQGFRMESVKSSDLQSKGRVPAPLRRKQAENGRGSTSPITRAHEKHFRPERPVQVNLGWIWSKSLSDIPMVYPVRKLQRERSVQDRDHDINAAGEWNKENTGSNIAATDGEAQWQDEFTKWKNRRRSTTTDKRRKSLDREHVIKQMTNGAMANFAKHDRDQQTPHRTNPHPPSSVHPTSSSHLRPHTRALLFRSYATEASHIPQGPSGGAMPASDGLILGEEAHFPSLASDAPAITTPSLECPFSSQTLVKAQGSTATIQPTSVLAQCKSISTNHISTLATTLQPRRTPKLTNPRDQKRKDDPKSTFYPDELDKTATVPVADQAPGLDKYLFRTVSWSGSASLPRGFRRSEGSPRLSSALTARPYGTKQSRVSSLPRVCTVDDDQSSLLSREREESLPPSAQYLLTGQTAASELSRASIGGKTDGLEKQNAAGQVEEEAVLSGQNVFTANGHHHHQPRGQSPLTPRPFSNLPSHHNSSTLVPSTKMDHSIMRVSLALKPNSRPDFGLQTHRDSTGVRVISVQPGSPAELCQLCVDDEIMAVDGVNVALMNSNQWQDKMTSALQNGSLTMDVRRYGNKDWSSNDGQNQLSQNRLTLNLTTAASVLIGCPDRQRFSGTSSTEALKCNGHTDNALQDKAMNGGGLSEGHESFSRSKDCSKIVRTTQKRRAEFFKQTGGSESAISDLQVPSLSPSSSSWSWDHEEERRRQEKWQEEQERLLQEQYQRDQERLEAEWQQAQQDAMGDLKSENTSPVSNCVSMQTHKAVQKEPSPDRDQLKETGSMHQSERITELDWAAESCSFAQLSPAHRAKSLSTPALAGCHKQTKGLGDDRRKRLGQPVSKAEKERQQILEEMKKRTQLLTDNSWIRQRSSSLYKEPMQVEPPLKRYESLDFLDSLRQSPVSAATFGFPRPQSAAGAYCAPTRNASSRYSTGGISSRKTASMDIPHHGSAWTTCDISEELKQESRFETGTGSASVTLAVTNSNGAPRNQPCVLQITE